MSNAVEQALAELKQLPEDAQELVVEEFLELIRSEAKWDKLFADPRSEGLLERLAVEADEEDKRGEAYDFDPATKPTGGRAP